MAKAKVAPLAGAWIEMFVLSAFSVISPVAPLAGAWIEITVIVRFDCPLTCRSPRGSVD